MHYRGIFFRSVRDLIRKEILREILLSSIPLMIVWLLVGWALWTPLLHLSTTVIGWLPFSLVRADGALLILIFVWSLAVLISYAFFTAIFGPLLFRKMHKGYYYYSFGALLFFAALWGWVLVTNYGPLSRAISQKLLTWLPFQTVAEASAWLLNFYILYNLFILSLYLVLAIYRKDFLYVLREMDYPDLDDPVDPVSLKHGSVAIRDALIFLGLSILLFPLLFLPVINVLIQLFLWAWLYRDSSFVATCQLYCEAEDYRRLRNHRFAIWSIAFAASLLNLVPIVNIFTPFFAQIMAFHWIMNERLSRRRVEEKSA